MVNNFMCTVDTVSKAVDSGNWESQKDHFNVPGHILPETRIITPDSPFPTVHHPTAHPHTHTGSSVHVLYSVIS